MASISPRSNQVTLQDREVPFKEKSKPLDGPTELGCHVSYMGHKSESICQSLGYRPTLC
jgi:hypothetical protein